MRMNLSEAMEVLAQQQANAENNSGGKYVNEFRLKGDGNHTIIKPLVEDLNDVEVHSVHKVRMVSKNGKSYSINVDCLGNNCPLCKEAPNHVDEKYPTVPFVTKAKTMVTIPLIRLYDNDGKREPSYELLNWSAWMYKKVAPQFMRMKPFARPMELLRTGASTDTSYSAFPMDTDFEGGELTELNGTVAELKSKYEVKDDDIIGRGDSFIRSWTAEQMEQFISTGAYPNAGGGNTSSTPTDVPAQQETAPQPRQRVNHGF